MAVGHDLPHTPPLQVAVPPDGGGQLVHAAPQWVASLSWKQVVPHRCQPDGQAMPHAPPLQTAEPPVAAEA